MKKSIYFNELTNELWDHPENDSDLHYLGMFGKKAIKRIERFLNRNSCSSDLLKVILECNPKAKNINKLEALIEVSKGYPYKFKQIYNVYEMCGKDITLCNDALWLISGYGKAKHITEEKAFFDLIKRSNLLKQASAAGEALFNITKNTKSNKSETDSLFDLVFKSELFSMFYNLEDIKKMPIKDVIAKHKQCIEIEKAEKDRLDAIGELNKTSKEKYESNKSKLRREVNKLICDFSNENNIYDISLNVSTSTSTSILSKNTLTGVYVNIETEEDEN